MQSRPYIILCYAVTQEPFLFPVHLPICHPGSTLKASCRAGHQILCCAVAHMPICHPLLTLKAFQLLSNRLPIPFQSLSNCLQLKNCHELPYISLSCHKTANHLPHVLRRCQKVIFQSILSSMQSSANTATLAFIPHAKHCQHSSGLNFLFQLAVNI